MNLLLLKAVTQNALLNNKHYTTKTSHNSSKGAKVVEAEMAVEKGRKAYVISKEKAKLSLTYVHKLDSAPAEDRELGLEIANLVKLYASMSKKSFKKATLSLDKLDYQMAIDQATSALENGVLARDYTTLLVSIAD